MKRVILSLSIVVAIYSLLFGQNAERNLQDVESATRRLVEAQWNRNTTLLEEIVDSSFVATTSSGRQVRKEQAIVSLRSYPALRKDISFSLEQIQVSIAEDRSNLTTATSAARLVVKDTSGQEIGSQDFVAEWVKRPAGWRLSKLSSLPKILKPSVTSMGSSTAGVSRVVSLLRTDVECGVLNVEKCGCPAGQTGPCHCESCSFIPFTCEKCACDCKPGGGGGGHTCPPQDHYWGCETSGFACNPDAPLQLCKCIDYGCVHPIGGGLTGGPIPPTEITGAGYPIIMPKGSRFRLVAIFPTSFADLDVKSTGPTVTYDPLWGAYGSEAGVVEKDILNDTGAEMNISATVKDAAGAPIDSNGGGAASTDLGILGWGYRPPSGGNTVEPHKAILLVIRTDGTTIPSSQLFVSEGRMEVAPHTTMLFRAVFPQGGPVKITLRGSRPGEAPFDIWATPANTTISWSYIWSNDSDRLATISVTASKQGAPLDLSNQNFSQGTLKVFGFGYFNTRQGRNPYQGVLIATPVSGS